MKWEHSGKATTEKTAATEAQKRCKARQNERRNERGRVAKNLQGGKETKRVAKRKIQR